MKIKLVNLLLAMGLGSLAGCETIEPTKIQNLNQGKILVVGHGGSGFQSYFNPLPTNSLVSVRNALDVLQADGVELDVQLTADNQLILYHDEFLETQTSCSGCITNQTAEEVLRCRYNLDITNNLKEREPLITLETVLARYATSEKKPIIFIDIKLLNACYPDKLPPIPDFAAALADLITKYNAHSWTHVESSSVPLLLDLQARDRRFWLSYYTRNPAADIAVAARYKFAGITVFNSEITAEQVQEAHRQHLFVTVLGIKSRSGLLNTIRKNPDAIQTDNIPMLINIMQD